jgi:hypothetical protein
MRILQANKFYRIVGGSDRYYFDIIRLLESKGHQVVPFAMHDRRNVNSPYKEYFVSHLDYNQGSLSFYARNWPRILGKLRH